MIANSPSSFPAVIAKSSPSVSPVVATVIIALLVAVFSATEPV